MKLKSFGSQTLLTALHDDTEVMNIDSRGSISTLGGIEAANKTFTVQQGLVTAQNVKVTVISVIKGFKAVISCISFNY